jgi:hypothetical protein
LPKGSIFVESGLLMSWSELRIHDNFGPPQWPARHAVVLESLYRDAM